MFQFTEAQSAVRELVRKFAENEIKPLADELDKTGRFPSETVAALAEMGVMGLNIPEEYGGVGQDEICKALTIAEISRCCASTAEMLAVHLFVNDLIYKRATEEQKREYLPQAAQGKLGAFCLTEPGAGSDAAALRTKAVQDGDDWILTGTKVFISNFGPDEGNHFVIFAVTDPEKGTRGMTAFLVGRDTPGLMLGKTEDKMGLRAAAVSELILKDCRVPSSAIMGKVGEGFKIAMSGLDGGRIGISAQSVGLGWAAMEEGVKYAKERAQFGRPIAANQGLQWYIADMATRLEAAWLLTLQAASKRQNKEDGVSKAASMAKYYAAETANYVCDLALQLHGGYGYMKDYPIERMYRDARILRIYEGTSEVQKIVIAKEVLKG